MKKVKQKDNNNSTNDMIVESVSRNMKDVQDIVSNYERIQSYIMSLIMENNKPPQENTPLTVTA